MSNEQTCHLNAKVLIKNNIKNFLQPNNILSMLQQSSILDFILETMLWKSFIECNWFFGAFLNSLQVQIIILSKKFTFGLEFKRIFQDLQIIPCKSSHVEVKCSLISTKNFSNVGKVLYNIWTIFFIFTVYHEVFTTDKNMNLWNYILV